jgi:predicted anti-sigma-YlaC factor YlaD
MKRCPDQLTIQAVIDGEEKDQQVIFHIKNCSACCLQYRQLKSLVSLADKLKSIDKLPTGFYHQLEKKIKPTPFPALQVAAAAIFICLVTLFLLGPDYFEWWLSVGITRQVGLILDAFLDLLAISRMVNLSWVISIFAALVALELIILKMLKNLEGWQNG